MATTPNYDMTLLEVGQKEKEITINTNFSKLDTVVKAVSDAVNIRPVYKGEAETDPVDPLEPLGSTYFNTATNKLKFLRSVKPTVWTNVA